MGVGDEGGKSKNRLRMGSGVKKNREEKYLRMGWGGGGPSGDGLLLLLLLANERDVVGLGVANSPLLLLPIPELLVGVGVRNPSDPIRLCLRFKTT